MCETNRCIRVLVVDDHSLMRTGIRLILEDNPNIQMVGEATNGMEMLELAHQLNPDVILVDISMPEMSGIDATRRVTEDLPHVRVLGLTANDNEQDYHELIQAGALGYVVKGATDTELFAAIEAVYQNQAFVSPSLAQKILENQISGAKIGVGQKSVEELTDREQEILYLIAAGRTGREIAETLVISINTVDRHRTNIMRKLNLHSKTELVKYAIREGLINL